MNARATTYVARFTDAVELLCKKRPSDEIVASWLDRESQDDRLQEFAIEHGPDWAQGIALLDAAHVAASQPTEGDGHEDAPDEPVEVPQLMASALLAYVDFAAARRRDLGAISQELELIDHQAREALQAYGLDCDVD